MSNFIETLVKKVACVSSNKNRACTELRSN